MFPNEEGAFSTTQYLINQGHKKIGVVGCELAGKVIAARLEGAKKALEEAGLKLEPQHYFVTKSFSAQEGMLAADYFHRLPNKPTAIFIIAGDYVACGFLARLRQLAYTVPDDFALIGFDGLELASFLYPQLTTVRQPVEKMAEAATKLLLERLENPTKACEIRCFKTELIIRDSA